MENKNLSKAINEVGRMVEKGEQLSHAMSSRGNIFPPILINMVEAGEISGSFEVSMLRMAEHFEKEAKLKAVVKKASIYPIILLLVSIAVVLIMLVKVIPNFMGMFDDMNTKLPAVTMAVVHASNFARKFWILLVAVVLLIIVGLKVFSESEQGKETISRLTLKLPGFGRLAVKSASARLGRTLGTLLSAGVPITKALEMTAKTMDNEVIKKLLYNSVAEVERGVPVSYALEASHIFPSMVSHLIRIGEQSGRTEEMLDKLAQYYEDEVENSTASLMTALEPLMIVVLAGMIGFLLMAIFQPILSMYQGLNNI
jgi:type IV pilus assembly protein PilC